MVWGAGWSAVPVALHPGDRIVVGTRQLELRAIGSSAEQGWTRGPEHDSEEPFTTQMAMVVGDVIQYSTISEYTDTEILVESLETLYGSTSYRAPTSAVT